MITQLFGQKKPRHKGRGKLASLGRAALNGGNFGHSCTVWSGAIAARNQSFYKAISARIFLRSMSIGMASPRFLKHQYVQPLQLGAPSSAAPT